MTKNLIGDAAELKRNRDYQSILQIVEQLSDLKVYSLVKYFDKLTETDYIFQELAVSEVAVDRKLIEVLRNGEITYLVARKTLERRN